MFRVVELSGSKIEVFEGAEHVVRPPPGVFRWIDLQGQDDAQLELLRERFDFHPLAIEDCSHLDQRPKLEEYGDHLFIVTQGFHCPDAQVHDLELRELHGFIGDRFLVTVHETAIAAVERVLTRLKSDARPMERGVDFIYYLLADGMVDDVFPVLDRIADELEDLEDAVLSSPKHDDLKRIFELKHHLVHMRKVLSPQRDVLGVLTKRGDSKISERTALYLRDVYDHLVRINESIESNRDLLGNALEAYLSATAQRTNEIMKHLTILSAVFLPLAFVVGFFGQNFDNFPFMKEWVHSDALMWVMVAICLFTPLTMVLWFRKRGWL